MLSLNEGHTTNSAEEEEGEQGGEEEDSELLEVAGVVFKVDWWVSKRNGNWEDVETEINLF